MKLNYLQKSIVILYVISIGVFLFKNHSNKEFYINVVKDFSTKNYKKLDSLINPRYGVFTNTKDESFDRKIGNRILVDFIRNSSDFDQKKYNTFNPNFKDTLYSNLEFGEIKYIGNGKFQKDDSFFSNFNGQYLLDPNYEIKGFALTGEDLENEERLKAITKYKISATCKDHSKNYEFYFGIENHKVYLSAVTINPIMSDEGIELERSYINSDDENEEYRNNLTSYINKSNFFENPKLLSNLTFLDVSYSDKNIIIGNTFVNRILESTHDNFIQVKTKNNQIKTVYLTDSTKNFICAGYGEVFKINGSSELLLIGNTYTGMGEATYSLQYIDLEKPDFGLNDNVFGESSSHYIITVNYDTNGKENRVNDFSIRQLSVGQYIININEKNLMLKWNGVKFVGDLIGTKEDTSGTSLKNDTTASNVKIEQISKPDSVGIIKDVHIQEIQYTVTVPKAFFYDIPGNNNSRRKAFLVQGESIIGLKETDRYVYCEFTNSTTKKTTKGWILKDCLKTGL